MKSLAGFALAMLLIAEVVSAGPVFFGESLSSSDGLPEPGYSAQLPAYYVTGNLVAIKAVPYTVISGDLAGVVPDEVNLKPISVWPHLSVYEQRHSTDNPFWIWRGYDANSFER